MNILPARQLHQAATNRFQKTNTPCVPGVLKNHASGEQLNYLCDFKAEKKRNNTQKSALEIIGFSALCSRALFFLPP